MPQYQMHPRNATTGRLILAIIVGFCLLILLTPIAPLAAATPAQNEPGKESHLLLLPLGETPIELLTHIADVAVSVDGDRSLRMEITASYRLHNPTRTRTTLLVQVNSPPDDDPTALALPQAISLEMEGQIVPLQSTGNGLQQTAQISFEPDERRTLLLRYTLRFVTTDLPAFVYPASALDVWPGRVGSWRVTLNFADGGSGLLAPDNWLAAEPAGWSYNGSRLQWLSEDNFPRTPLRWQVIHPTIWQEILTYRQAIRQQPTVAKLAGLGNIYRQLYERADRWTDRQTETKNDNRERFYALALGNYLDAIRLAGESAISPQEAAPLHRALAGLYRSRSLQSDSGIDSSTDGSIDGSTDGNIDPAYVELMVREAEAALAGFSPAAANEQPDKQSNERNEVTGWLADGLRLQARESQQRKDWPAALALLDRLAALPADLVDPASLAEERRLLLLEQALQFLAQGNQEAALALAGPALADGDLLPALERRTLFARWEFVLTIRPDELALVGTASASAGREEEAGRIVDQLALAWNANRPPTGEASLQFDGKTLTVTLSGIPLGNRLALIQATPQTTHWALLRTLLVNADAEIESASHLIWQRTTMRHTIDLRPVADQWNGIAAGLERESLAAVTGGGTEDRIRGELLAITHRQEAERWQKLVRDSRVQIELTADPAGSDGAGSDGAGPDGAGSDSAGPENSRVWSLPLTDAPQPMAFFSESLSLTRLFLAIALAMAFVFALAGILWLLL